MSLSQLADAIEVTAATLAAHPLPDLGEHTEKNERGRVLVVGGSAETVGAVALAGIGALRVGAGKLQVATVASGRAALSVALPEARVIGLPETPQGAIDPAAAEEVVELASRVDAVVLGTGSLDPDTMARLRDEVLERVGEPVVVLDANALIGLERPVGEHRVLMPNPQEMEALIGPYDDPRQAAEKARARFGAAVALRGPDTWMTAPGQPAHVHRDGVPGLATSGSGDVLAGALGGLAARGLDPFAAMLWAVTIHAAAGRRLAERIGATGFLARELLEELPGALDERTNSR